MNSSSMCSGASPIDIERSRAPDCDHSHNQSAKIHVLKDKNYLFRILIEFYILKITYEETILSFRFSSDDKKNETFNFDFSNSELDVIGNLQSKSDER